MTGVQSMAEIDRMMLRFAKRRRRLRAANAIGVGIAIACAWLVCAAVADRFFRLPMSARCVVSIGFGLIIVLTIAWAVRWLWQRQSSVDIAQIIESRVPLMRDRLTTIVTQRAMPMSEKASIALIESLQQNTAEQVRRFPPERSLTLTGVRPAGILLTGALAITLASAVVIGGAFQRLLGRELFPWANIAPVMTTSIEVPTGSPDVVAGQPLAVVADLTPDPGAATVWAGASADDLQPIEMTHAFGDRYTATLPVLHRSVVYRVKGGDAESAVFAAHVVLPPAVSRLDLRLETPDRSTRIFDNSDGVFAAIRGTHVFVLITATEPLADATLMLGGVTVLTESTHNPQARTAEFYVVRNEPWSIKLLNTKGVIGFGCERMRIAALPPGTITSQEVPARVPAGYEPAENNYLRAIAATRPAIK